MEILYHLEIISPKAEMDDIIIIAAAQLFNPISFLKIKKLDKFTFFISTMKISYDKIAEAMDIYLKWQKLLR